MRDAPVSASRTMGLAPPARHLCWRLVFEAGRNLADVDDNLRGLLRLLYRHKLVGTVEVHASGKDIRTGQPLETELRPVSTAADRLRLRCHLCLLHSLEHDVDNVNVRIYLLLHVIVLV